MELILPFILGGILWQFAEYVIHRFLGHVVKFNNLFKIEHDRHHRETHYFSPLFLKLLSAVPISGTLTGALVLFFPLDVSFSFAAGFVIFYGLYEFIHWSLHVFPPLSPYGRMVRKHHYIHHFKNSNINHGVTTPIFDYIFGTAKTVDQVRVPEKVVMKWLVDDKNQIKPKFQSDYTY